MPDTLRITAMEVWWEEATDKAVHWRQLTTFAGAGESRSLPIERATLELAEMIWQNPLSGVRSPPGSGKTTFLPDLLHAWVKAASCEGAVVIVLPTQYACQKIKTSLVRFRGWSQDKVRLVTGVDKEDVFWKRYTEITVTTYGMMWQWLSQPDGQGRSKVLWENSAFLLDELAGTLGGTEGEVRTDPQFLEVARILAAEVRLKPTSYRLLATGASLEAPFLQKMLGSTAGFCCALALLEPRANCSCDCCDCCDCCCPPARAAADCPPAAPVAAPVVPQGRG